MTTSTVKVPASTKAVKSFLAENRDKFINSLNKIQGLINKSLSGIRVYKIYSRKDMQGDDLKNPRKVRLKFNSYYKGEDSASLWTTPDIIGFTIVVSFPSEISKVCEAIDSLIDEQKLRIAPKSKDHSLETQNNESSNPIITKYGRAITSQGYFACHYNVVESGPGKLTKPVCEVQIKTILHDAWGAKSHDLTYKPSSKIDGDLVRSFEVLGDMLAKIDEHSDIVRKGIERAFAVRARKKAPVLEASIKTAVHDIVKKSEIKIIIETMMGLDLAHHQNEIEKLSQKIEVEFEINNREAAIAYVYLAFMSKDKIVHQQSLEAIETWFENERDSLGKAYSRSVSALAMFVNNDTPSAIDEAETAIAILDGISEDSLDEESKKRYSKILHSTCSSLAYYYAETIGSHDGRMSDGQKYALQYIERAAEARRKLGLVYDFSNTDEDILKCLKDKSVGVPAYSSLDNELFVRIQTAVTISDVSKMRERLKFIYDNRPEGMGELEADALYEFHDFCARCRLAELELEGV